MKKVITNKKFIKLLTGAKVQSGDFNQITYVDKKDRTLTVYDPDEYNRICLLFETANEKKYSEIYGVLGKEGLEIEEILRTDDYIKFNGFGIELCDESCKIKKIKKGK